MTKQHDCLPERIGRFLNSELSEPEEAELEAHLDTCETCRAKLTDSTASLDFWENAQEFLADDIYDLDSLTASKTEFFDDVHRPETENRTNEVSHILQLLQPTDDPRMLGKIGIYEIAGVIGTGGMGIVLKAFDSALSRYVAIKVLAPHLASSGAARQRFAREAQAAASVVHEHVIAIHGVSQFNGLPYLVMPCVRGTSLQKRIDECGQLSVAEILRISVQAASGLAAAHAQGLVHRDIKPANLLLEEGVERVAVTDFGLARAADDASLTRTGVIAGTPQYMSPEQARGDSVDHRSDLFSLGSVMYAMATGYPPFRAESSYAVLRRITDSEPKPIRLANSEIPDWLAWIIAKLQSKNPGDRFRSAAEVANLLSQCLAHVQQPTQRDLPSLLQLRLRSNSWKSRTKNLIRSIVAVLIALTVFSIIEAVRKSNPPADAELKQNLTTRPDHSASSKKDLSHSQVVVRPKELPQNGPSDSSRQLVPNRTITLSHETPSVGSSVSAPPGKFADWFDGDLELEINEISETVNQLELDVELEWP